MAGEILAQPLDLGTRGRERLFGGRQLLGLQALLLAALSRCCAALLQLGALLGQPGLQGVELAGRIAALLRYRSDLIFHPPAAVAQVLEGCSSRAASALASYIAPCAAWTLSLVA